MWRVDGVLPTAGAAVPGRIGHAGTNGLERIQWQEVGNVAALDVLRGVERLGAVMGVDGMQHAIGIEVEQDVGHRVEGGLEFLPGFLDFPGALRDLVFERHLLCGASQQQPHEQGEHGAESHTESALDEQGADLRPACARLYVQQPFPIGHLHRSPDALLERLAADHIFRGSNHLPLAGIGMPAPQFVPVAAFGQALQPQALEGVGETDGDEREAPELRFLALRMGQKHRQPTHRAQPALNEVQGPGQSQAAGVAGQEGFGALHGVGQLVEADRGPVRFQWNGVTDDAARRQTQ